jgi:hypothetical protein
MPENRWPLYRVGNSDYIHALGVIASVFNLLELRFRSLFPIYTRLPSKPAYTLFAKISNEMRLELIEGAIEFSSHPEQIKDDVRFSPGSKYVQRTEIS